MTDNRFNNKDGDQNVAQGDGAVGKQINDHRTTSQAIDGNENIAAGRDINITNNHYPPASPNSPASRNLLPSEDAVFLYRETELAWLDQHLLPDKVVAVCGPGGMGKTSLAARAVRRLPADRFPDGIIFHTFYHQAKTAQAVQTIALALHLPVQGDVQQQVAAALGSRQALLVLDGAEEADDLTAVLGLRGQCGVLITTRKKSDCGPLRLDLQPLPDEQSEDVLRAWGGDAGDQEAIEEIAELLGGWPVALRLAGHYLHSTGEPATDYLRWLEEEPFKELGESEEHQRDNAALLLRRSTAQVGEDARLVLALAGCLAFDSLSMEPITALLSSSSAKQPKGFWARLKARFSPARQPSLSFSSEDKSRSRDAVHELVNYGLLERRGDRLHIGHALIHEYAARNLALSTDALERVAAYYIEWCAEQSAAGVPGYALLDAERAHCLRLIAACLDGELWGEVKGLVGAINTYLDRQGWWTEMLLAIEMRLTAARKAEDRRDEAWCLNSLGYTCNSRGDKEQALVWFKQCLPICRELDDREDEGVTLNNMALIYDDLGKYEQALEYYKQDLSICREGNDREGEGATLNNIATVYYNQKDYEQALQYYEQSLPIHREVGNKIVEGITLNNIAAIYRTQGEYSKAIEYREQDLAICRELGDRAGEAVSCWNIGTTYYDMDDLAKAEEYIALAVEIAEKIGHPELEKYRNGLEQVRAKRQM